MFCVMGFKTNDGMFYFVLFFFFIKREIADGEIVQCTIHNKYIRHKEYMRTESNDHPDNTHVIFFSFDVKCKIQGTHRDR